MTPFEIGFLIFAVSSLAASIIIPFKMKMPIKDGGSIESTTSE